MDNKTREISWWNNQTHLKDFGSSYLAFGVQMKILKDDVYVIKISLVVEVAKMGKAWLKGNVGTSGQM